MYLKEIALAVDVLVYFFLLDRVDCALLDLILCLVNLFRTFFGHLIGHDAKLLLL